LKAVSFQYQLVEPDIASPEPQLVVVFRVLEGPSQLLWQCQGLMSPLYITPKSVPLLDIVHLPGKDIEARLWILKK
jgi:hypothetical protein